MRLALSFAAGAATAVFTRHAAAQIRLARQEKRNRRAWNMYRPKGTP